MASWRRQHWHIFKNNGNGGFTIVESLVTLTIMSVFAYGMAAMISTITKMQHSLNQKFEMMALQARLLNIVTNPKECTCMIKVNKNYFQVNPSNNTIHLQALGDGCSTSGTPNTAESIVALGAPINDGSDVLVASIDLVDVKPIGSSGATFNNFTGNLEIRPSIKNGMTRKPVSVPILFSTTGTGSLQLDSCQSPESKNEQIRCSFSSTSNSQAYFEASVAADMCNLTSFSTDQSSSGHSRCTGSFNKGNRTWNLKVTSKNGGIFCEWHCQGQEAKVVTGSTYCTPL